MGWPLAQDYNEAVQNPRTSFSDPELRDGQPTLNPLGLPLPRSGNFADVYEFVCPAPQTRWAVKCFTRPVAGLRERYSEISRHLQDARLPFTVDFQFLQQGIRIRGQWYPILKMRWVEGLLLNEFVCANLDKPAHLQALSQIWLRMARWLRLARTAHCDLQHGNVLLVPGSRGTRASGSPSLAVKLIDYDGMFVPALARSNSGEVGHPNYQHPQRARDKAYSLEVDRVPLLVVATALRGLIVGGRGLWDRHDNGDNLLFRESDLRDPAGSTLFRELGQLSDPLLQTLVGHLARACQGRLGDAPLLEEVLPEEKPPAPARPPARAQGAAPVTVAMTPEVDWDFSDPAAPIQAPRTKGKGPVWKWVAAGAAALLVLMTVAIFFATRKSGEASSKGPDLAENRPAKDRTGTVKPSPKDSATKPPPKEDAPKPPPQNPLPPEAGPGMFYLAACRPELLATSSKVDRNWILWDAWPGANPREFTGHEGAVTCIAIDREGRRAVTGSADRTLRLWDLKTKKETLRLHGHREPIVAVALSPDGKRALSADLGPRVRLWDLDARKEVRSFEHPDAISAVAFALDGKQVLCAIGKAVPGSGEALWLWDAEMGNERGRFRGARTPVTSLAVSPDGKYAATGAEQVIRVWDLGRGLVRWQKRFPQAQAKQVSFSPDSRLVVAGVGDAVLIWKATNGLLVHNFPQGGQEIVVGVFVPDKAEVLIAGRRGSTIRPERRPVPAPVVVKPPVEPPGVQKDKRQPVPRAGLAAAEEALHKLFQAEYAAKNLDEWQRLAGKLRDYSDQVRDNPAHYYVALRDSRDAWVRSGNLEWMLKMAARLEAAFEVNPLQVRCEGLEVAGKAGDLGHIQRELAETALSLFEEALDEDEYALSSRFVAVARPAAVAAKDEALLARARAAEVDLGVVRREHDRVKRSLQAVTANPGDRAASTAVGKFLCFFKDDWEGGLPLLERGNDAGLAALARQDLATPADGRSRKALGDSWWNLAKEMTNPMASRPRAACYQRAHHWYRQALVGLSRTARQEVQRRLKILRAEYPVLNEPWRHLLLSDARVVSDNLVHLGPGKTAPSKRAYRGPIEVIVSARTTKNNIRLRAGRGGLVIFNWEGKPGELRIHRPDGPGGKTVGTLAVSKQEPLTARRWYELRWRLTATGMKVWVDGSLVFEEERPYDLSAGEPVAVEANDSSVDVRSVVVRRIR